jgi:parvulin-like peptidyl-prolyl isomerase
MYRKGTLKMIRFLLSFTLVAATAMAQTQGTPAAPQAHPPAHAGSSSPQTLPTLNGPKADESASVPANAPVLTVHGICDNAQKGADASACNTVLTKQQFEKMINAINSNNQPVPPQVRRNIAQRYAELLAFAQAAEKTGVENDPRFTEVMRLQRLNILADMYRRDFEEKNKTASPQEIQAYYDQNKSKYEEVKLSRIFIPKNNPTGQDKAGFEQKAAQVANDIRERAAKGEKFETLQKEAYTILGLTSPPPSVDAGTRRKGMLLPQEEEEVFALKAGQVSKVEQEPSGYIIYKVDSKQVVPLDQEKDAISRELYRQKFEAKIREITGSVHADLNDQYFGPPPANAPPGAPGAPPAAAPPASKPTTAPAGKPSTPPKSTSPKTHTPD